MHANVSRAKREGSTYLAMKFLESYFGDNYTLLNAEHVSRARRIILNVIITVRVNESTLTIYDEYSHTEYLEVKCPDLKGTFVVRKCDNNKIYMMFKGVLMAAGRYGIKSGFWINIVNPIHAYWELGVKQKMNVGAMKRWLNDDTNAINKLVVIKLALEQQY